MYILIIIFNQFIKNIKIKKIANCKNYSFVKINIFRELYTTRKKTKRKRKRRLLNLNSYKYELVAAKCSD